MKKNKKQLKREKKNLRRQKEMMRIQKLTEKSIKNSYIAPKTDIHIDGFGKVSRFVNRKDENVLNDTADTEMFGCEIVKDVPEYVRSFSDKMGLGENYLRVPIRKNKGLTGSGKSFQCHYNSMLLAMRFGGERLSGYFVHTAFSKEKNKYATKFILHSVWVNSKGNSSCVSNNYEKHGTGWKDSDHILFIPVYLNEMEDAEYVFHDGIIMEDWEEKDAFWIKPFSDSKEVRYIVDIDRHLSWGFQFLPNLTIRGMVHKTNLHRVMSKTGRTMDMMHKEHIKVVMDEGGFTQNSLATGKSWSEFKSELLATV